jgi:hypothetical protein
MANPEHLRILKQGIKAWNKWRNTNPQSIDLRWAKLLKADLSNADLSNADLYEANVYGANLSNVNLKGAKIFNVNLSHANLTHANFGDAVILNSDFSYADLSHSNLRSTVLFATNFTKAILREAILEDAFLGDTVFGNTDLTGAIGLASCQHNTSSILDIQTLAKSGALPLAFLQGCGLSDTLIEYIPSLINEPIQFHSCFISYSNKDQKFAQKLHGDLQDRGVRCWFAPHDLKIGDKFRSVIDESIQIHDKLMIILSKQSIASDWVAKEAETAMERERQQGRTIIFPIQLDNEIFNIQSGWAADIHRSRNIGDFRRWKNTEFYQKAFERLLRDLKAGDKKV